MARKRGRPPKTPSSSAKKSHGKQSVEKEDHAWVDLNTSDEEALEDIDNLSPKKAMALLRNLDVLRERMKNKIPNEGTNTESLNPLETEEVNAGLQAKKGAKASDEDKRQPSANDEEAVEAVVEESNNGCARDSQSNDTVVGDSFNTSEYKQETPNAVPRSVAAVADRSSQAEEDVVIGASEENDKNDEQA
ncbi:hypothetical protein RIF29_33625 [Crotalaria pallida]|uniref:Uncharacterized protein n=1 Tax=Crotalaria pallida TaxID=3830 RepID=A0AAN9HU60_CROPI